jgi:hypothetical protein
MSFSLLPSSFAISAKLVPGDAPGGSSGFGIGKVDLQDVPLLGRGIARTPPSWRVEIGIRDFD